ncbi:MAG: cyclophilin-like fold protein [bacterium]|jgi:hypothetical protein
MKIEIQIGETRVQAQLLDNEAGREVYAQLPLESSYQVWGDEIYFSLPRGLSTKGEREIVEVGDLAYWSPGKAFCIFYGRTPASEDERPRAASKVTVFGKVEGDARIFRKVKGKRIIITALKEEPKEKKENSTCTQNVI